MSELVTLLIVLGVVAGVIGLFILGKYLIKKGIVDEDDVPEIVDDGKAIVNFAYIFAISAGFNKDDADKIKGIIFDTLEYINTLSPSVSIENKKKEAIEYINDLCLAFEIPVDDNKQIIIEQIVDVMFNYLEKKMG